MADAPGTDHDPGGPMEKNTVHTKGGAVLPVFGMPIVGSSEGSETGWWCETR